MSSHAEQVIAWWRKLKPKRELVGLWLGAISLTIVGTIALNWLTAWRFWQLIPHRWWNVGLFVFASVLIWWSANILTGYRRLMREVVAPATHRLFHSETVEVTHDIDLQPALIALVSVTRHEGERRSHDNAVDRHIDAPKFKRKVCRYVLLIPSTKSKGNAEMSRDTMRLAHPYVTFEVAPAADFGDFASVYKVVEAAIQWTLAANPELRRDQIVVDVTGGTAIATAAAIFAGWRNGTTLEYIESPYIGGTPDHSFSKVKFKRVIIREELGSERTEENAADGKVAASG